MFKFQRQFSSGAWSQFRDLAANDDQNPFAAARALEAFAACRAGEAAFESFCFLAAARAQQLRHVNRLRSAS